MCVRSVFGPFESPLPPRGELGGGGEQRSRLTKTTLQDHDDVERAATLMALYDIRSKLRQQDNSSLIKAREKINALAAKQQAQAAAATASAEKKDAAAGEVRHHVYTYPR